MRNICAGIPFYGHPVEFIEHKGAKVDDVFVNAAVIAYYELKTKLYVNFTYEFGVAALIFVTYVTYHVISKIRGNEKNGQMNNFGIQVALLGLVVYSVGFTDAATYTIV